MADSQDVNTPADQVTAPTDPSTEENKAPETPEVPKDSQDKADPILEALSDDEPKAPKAKADKPEPKAETDKPKEEPKEPPKADETKAKDQPEGELKPKSENRFQKLANENRELKEQIEAAKQRDAQLAAEQQLLEGEDPETGQPYSAEDAQRIARYQTIEQERQQNQMRQHQLGLSAESYQIINDHPIFNESSPEFKPELAQKAADALEPYLIRDPNVPEIDPSTGQPTGKGQVIGSHVSPSAIYKPIADAYEMSRSEGQIEGQRQSEQMLAAADPSTSAGPAKRKEDPVMKILSSDD